MTTVPGTFHFLHPYVAHFTARGWRVDVLTGAGPVDDRLRNAVTQVHRVSWTRRPHDRGNAAAVREVRAVVSAGSYDVVHTHTPIASFVTRFAIATLPRRRRPAVIYTAHGFHFHEHGSRAANAAYALAEKAAGRATDVLVVINEHDRRAAQRLRIVPPDRLVLMPGIGLDLSHYRRTSELLASAELFRAGLGLPADAVPLAVVAELIPRKNHLAALAALRHNQDTRLHLCLAGDGPLSTMLVARAEQLGISRRVHFLGALDDVRPLVLSSAAVVLPSRQEGLSRAVMESLALGVPVIGGRVRGIADLVSPHGGLLVDPDDVVALSDAYSRIQEHERGDALVERLRGRLQTLSLESLLRRHEELYSRAEQRFDPPG